MTWYQSDIANTQLPTDVNSHSSGERWERKKKQKREKYAEKHEINQMGAGNQQWR
jgi:hypothetical protein